MNDQNARASDRQSTQWAGAGGTPGPGVHPGAGSAPWYNSTQSSDGVGQPRGVRKRKGGVGSCCTVRP